MKGFTLIETVIVIAFSAVMMLAIAVLAFNFNKISLYNQASIKSSGSASALIREIEDLVFSASEVLASHTFSGSVYSSSQGVLVLEIPSVDVSGNVISNTYDYAVFYVTGTNAYRILETNALSSRSSGTKILSTTISALTFSYNGADMPSTNIVTVDIQAQAYAKQEILSDHLREQIRLRNH